MGTYKENKNGWGVDIIKLINLISFAFILNIFSHFQSEAKIKINYFTINVHFVNIKILSNHEVLCL
jgi:hypothetical protein